MKERMIKKFIEGKYHWFCPYCGKDMQECKADDEFRSVRCWSCKKDFDITPKNEKPISIGTWGGLLDEEYIDDGDIEW